MALYKQAASRYWYASFRDTDGRLRRRSTGCKDKGAAQAVAAQWGKEAEQVKAGIITREQAAAIGHSARPTEEHLTEYEAALRAKGSDGHAKATVARCRRVCGELEVSALRDMTYDRLESWFVATREAGMLARTANAHRVALSGWINWLHRNARWVGDNPASHLPKYNEKAERVHQRRALAPAEAQRLLHAARLRPLAERGRERVTREGTKRANWTYAPLTPDNLNECAARGRAKTKTLYAARLDAEGRERAYLYRTLLGTGFRVEEARALRVADFNADGCLFHLILQS